MIFTQSRFDSVSETERLYEEIACLPDEENTLERGLKEAGLFQHHEKACQLASRAMSHSEVMKRGLTRDEAGAIACFTLEGDGKLDPPYIVINRDFATRDFATTMRLRRLVFLMTRGLRKLERFSPPNKVLYRGIRAKVPLTQNSNGGQAYEEGKSVMWWGYTSATTDPDVAKRFAGDDGTVFKIGGSDLWGYDIRPFSDFNEKEVLIESEAVLHVKKVTPGRPMIIDVEIQPFASLVFENIIPSGELKLTRQFRERGAGNGFASFVDEKTMTSFVGCAWKECPAYYCQELKYAIDASNPRIASKTGEGDRRCAIIGNTPIPLYSVVVWSIKILRSVNNDACHINIGVIPYDTTPDKTWDNTQSGWFFNCHKSILRSQDPEYRYKNNVGYGPRKEEAKYFHTGDRIDVEMNTKGAKGVLSFLIDGVSYGPAFENIPLDKPLMPCVLLRNKGDSIELCDVTFK